MSFFNFFRNIFGLPERPPEGDLNRQDNIPSERPSQFRNPIWSLDEDDDDDFRSAPKSHFGFHMDSDPLQIHRFFEQEMDEMLHHFQSFGFGGFFKEMNPRRALPGIEEEREKPETKRERAQRLRDYYLKPGFDLEMAGDREKQDDDIDGKIQEGAISSYFKTTPSFDFEPKGPDSGTLMKPGMSSQVFGRSMVSKTVRRPDGSVEHHRTVKDNEGNEETTVTRQIGEQSYSLTTRIKANGEQECIKNFVNVDEEKIQEFEKMWGSKL